MSDVIRKITIQANETGLEQTAASLNRLSVSQDAVSRSTLSMESKLNSLRKSLDEEYRAEQKMEAIEKTLTAARNQGSISIAEQNRLLGLAKLKYTEAGESAKLMGERMESAKELGKGLLAGLGTGAFLVGLAELPSKIMETVHEAAGLGHVAETIGITTTALQELQYTGTKFHVSTETMDAALEKFSKNLGVAATGSGALAKILRENHVVISGNLTKDLENYANLIQHSTNAEQKNMLTMAAFGKGAAEMGNMFSDGGEGIQKAANEADKLGLVMSGQTLKSAQDMDAEFIKMQAQLSVTFKEFMVTIAPALEVALGGIKNAVVAANAAIQAGQQMLPMSQQSDEAIQRNIASLKTLEAGHSANTMYPVLPGQRGYGRGNVPAALTDPIPGQIAAYQAEISRRADAPERADHVASLQFHSGSTITSDTSGAAAAKAAEAAAKAEAKKIQSVTDALNLQITNLTATNRQIEINNELAKANVDANTKEGKAIEALAGKFYDEKKAIADANAAAAFFAQTTASAFTGLVDGSLSVTDALGQMLKALAAAAIQAELLGQGPLAGITGNKIDASDLLGDLLPQSLRRKS
jgi:hypothetical protein